MFPATVSMAMQATGVAHPLAEIDLFVIVIPPEPLATFLAEHSYLSRGVPMLKRVGALGGQTVCLDLDCCGSFNPDPLVWTGGKWLMDRLV